MAKLFLLVDDDSDDAELFGEALSSISTPVEFHHVPDGYAAFEYLDDLSNRKPDLIFLDINMPEMNGWQVLTTLKNDVVLKGIPVLMYSTSSHQRDKEIANKSGAAGFMTKPSEYKILKNKLEHLALLSPEEIGRSIDI